MQESQKQASVQEQSRDNWTISANESCYCDPGSTVTDCVVPHNSQKCNYKIKLLQIVKVIDSNCCFILSQICLFDLIVKLNMFVYLLSFI